MAASTTMTIRVRPEVKEKLDRIATDTRRSKSFLAGQAVEAYVERELEIIEGIKRGLQDATDGKIVSHAEAMDELHAAIAAVEAKRSNNA